MSNHWHDVPMEDRRDKPGGSLGNSGFAADATSGKDCQPIQIWSTEEPIDGSGIAARGGPIVKDKASRN